LQGSVKGVTLKGVALNEKYLTGQQCTKKKKKKRLKFYFKKKYCQEFEEDK